ncbi:MAG: hypothetical protein HYS56_00030, partial [Candidatus Omnitrophica bacterium]|nr:hypothetical protein [Candidatus Omnitrophota bacterium]
MPFTLHTIDIFFVHYFPFTAIEQNRFDIYQYFQSKFPEYPYSYYPPLTFYITLIFQKLLQPALPTLASLMARFENLAFYHQGGSTVHFASLLQDPYLFRTLFLFKAHYLLFDAAIAWMLVCLADKPAHKAWAYRLWMVNPLVLHTSYGVGQIDLLVTFFLVLSFFMFERRYPKIGMAMLGAGGLVKLAPFYLAPGIAFSIGEKLRRKIILMISCLVPVAVLLFFSKDARVVLESWVVLAGAYWKINPSVMGISKLPLIFLLIGYGVVVFLAFSRKKKTMPLLSIFSLLLLLLWVTVSTRPRHLLWISPFLILELLRRPLIGAWLLTLLAAIWELHGAGITYRLGLLAPVDPTFFTSLPILDSFLSVAMDIRWVHRVC